MSLVEYSLVLVVGEGRRADGRSDEMRREDWKPCRPVRLRLLVVESEKLTAR